MGKAKKSGRVIFILISIIAVLGISATSFMVGETMFLPMIVQQNPSANPTATLLPSPTITPTPTQAGTPQPPATLQLLVNPDKDWALAYFAKSYNAAGRPVMQIYPGDNSLESERIKIPKGTIVLALETPVRADGDENKYWQLVEYKGRKDEILFLRAADVTKVTPSEPGNP